MMLLSLRNQRDGARVEGTAFNLVSRSIGNECPRAVSSAAKIRKTLAAEQNDDPMDTESGEEEQQPQRRRAPEKVKPKENEEEEEPSVRNPCLNTACLNSLHSAQCLTRCRC